MCGIVGLVSPGVEGAEVARRMLATISHRGPDGVAVQAVDGGRVVLGHARLAIIDLSPSGAQPMLLEGKDIWITFNGEIYNYRALRDELRQLGWKFRTSSDTEVILAGYAQWGEAILGKLDGIFAFGLWDGPRRRLWLVRDHLGVKPLYYTRNDAALAFASEPKALLVVPSVSRSPDPASVRDYLSFGYVPGSRTAFAAIAKLPGGHALIWENGVSRTYRYWNAADCASEDLKEESVAVRETARLLDLAAASQLESDVPVGLLVSGGIDSSAVAASASAFRAGMEGFVIGFDDARYDEREYARILASGCGIRLHERVVGTDYARSMLRQMFVAHDEPFVDSSSLPTLAVFEMVRANGYKVVLGGDGGDELFVGYRRYEKLATVEGHSQAPWPFKIGGARDAAQAMGILLRPHRYAGPAWRAYYERVRLLSYAEQCQILLADWRPRREDDLTWPFAEFWDARSDTIKAAQVFDVQTYLQEDILTKVDRASMRFGVEARVPLLAKAMVESALRTSTDLHLGGGRRKNILKAAVKGRLPDSLLSNRKRGFSLPLEVLLGPMLRTWLANIDESVLVRDGVLSPHIPRRVAENLDKIWTLFALDLWWSAWIRQESPQALS